MNTGVRSSLCVHPLAALVSPSLAALRVPARVLVLAALAVGSAGEVADEDDGDPRADRVELLLQLEPGHPGHHHVEHQTGRPNLESR